MDQYRQEHGPVLSEVEQLRLQASEAVIEANVDPMKLTPEEHRRVDILQAMASRAVIEANATVFRGRVE